MISKDVVLEALQPVVDPEIGMSVVDLGMIRDVVMDAEGGVEIKMVLTTPFCPLAKHMTGMVQMAVEALPGVKAAKVTLLDERWDPAWMKRPPQKA